MRWSKLRKLVKDCFAPELADRLDINSTAYGDCSCGHAWVTWDGEVIANFCTRAYGNVGGYFADPQLVPPKDGELVGYGEFSRQDAYHACWDFVHELSIEQALEDADPLVNFLALADKRVGRRRLERIDRDALHPLVARMYDLRVANNDKAIAA